jgi:hypothetical protein
MIKMQERIVAMPYDGNELSKEQWLVSLFGELPYTS